MKITLGKILLATLVATMLAGCGTPSTSSTINDETRVVVDDLGREVRVPVEIRRIVSLAPNLTEMVYAVGAGNRLVGVTTYCNYPAEAAEKAKIGDTMNPNMESIVALKPDVVLVSTASQIENFSQVLERNGTPVYVTDPSNLEAVFVSLRKLGFLLKAESQASLLVGELQGRVKLIEDQFRNGGAPKVFVQISREPLFAIGKESFITDLVERAGGISATADVPTAYPKLNPEAAAALNPDVIVLSDSDDNREPNSAFKNSKAVRNGRVHKIDADLLSRPGPRIVDALQQMAGFVRYEK